MIGDPSLRLVLNMHTYLYRSCKVMYVLLWRTRSEQTSQWSSGLWTTEWDSLFTL